MTALLMKNSSKINNNEFKKLENYNYSNTNVNKASNFITNYYYLTFYLLTILLLHYVSISSLNLKPQSPSSKLVNKGEFNANRAQVHLDTIASLPHGFNNLNNSRIFEYLLDQVKILEKQGENRLEYVIDDDKELSIPQHQVGLNNWLGSFATYYPTSNLVVKVKGENSNGKALLLSAHYDSRPLSNGATDAGVGVAKGFDVIVNFNNAEETFLLGARSFAMNKWYKNTHYFINLEGSGAGGKPLLFQSTNLRLTQALTSGHSHVNPIGNDLFNLRLLPSATDYQIYEKDLKLKGVDLAMYRNRALYHTLRDNVEFAPLETTGYMGEMVLGGIRNLESVEEAIVSLRMELCISILPSNPSLYNSNQFTSLPLSKQILDLSKISKITFIFIVILMGLGLPLLLAIHQGPPTGASPYLPYLICLFTTSLTFLPSGPTLLPLRNTKKLSVILGVLILSIYLISALTLFPQSFGINNTFIKLRVSSEVDKIINDVGLEPTEVVRGIKGGRSTFDVIRLDTGLPKELPDYDDVKYGMKVVNSTTTKNISEKEVTLNFNTPESKICYLQFVTPVDHLSVSHLTQEFKSMTDPNSVTSLTSAIRLFRNNPELPWKLKFISNTEELKI
ncbi:Zn-dependent exopeptidase [Conidiobolus coronatus NRRL 28638]|uniref:Peptide hydrolase n=1 Tax=Conidiobolus coronatus (strain ATCC 28846 / CBS 209.66 / NRRL 28638) TaxID=796925 RepID=A0A137P120_CONC2|nr:Zn-dependent exopeptidase [Conidiobolus coronatus NRRL 28638]|eukprot:KXN68747.1 Zn-dependent exopeptidase [Conidiobolus coronatus NRRL 28638]